MSEGTVKCGRSLLLKDSTAYNIVHIDSLQREKANIYQMNLIKLLH